MIPEEKKTNDNLESVEDIDLAGKNKFSGFEKEAGESEKKILKKEKEIAQEVAGSEKDNAYNKILSKVKAQQSKNSDDEEVMSDAANTFQKEDAESQIKNLMDLAMNKGVIHAVKVARHLDDNYVLDMFHDKLLVDELHNALLDKGLLKEID